MADTNTKITVHNLAGKQPTSCAKNEAQAAAISFAVMSIAVVLLYSNIHYQTSKIPPTMRYPTT